MARAVRHDHAAIPKVDWLIHTITNWVVAIRVRILQTTSRRDASSGLGISLTVHAVTRLLIYRLNVNIGHLRSRTTRHAPLIATILIHDTRRTPSKNMIDSQRMTEFVAQNARELLLAPVFRARRKMDYSRSYLKEICSWTFGIGNPFPCPLRIGTPVFWIPSRITRDLDISCVIRSLRILDQAEVVVRGHSVPHLNRAWATDV